MSSNSYLTAVIRFFDPVLAGGDLAEIARYYRPLLKLRNDCFTSCTFERIGDGRGKLILGQPVSTVIRLVSMQEIEEFLGSSIRQIFPKGSLIELVANDVVVASGETEALSDRIESP